MRNLFTVSSAALLTLSFAAYAQNTAPPQDPQQPPPAQTETRSPAGDVGSGVGDAGKGAAKGTGAAAAGAGKAAGDIVTLHPVGAAENAGKGAGKAAGDVGTGAVKGTGKVAEGTGKGVGKIFHHGHKDKATQPAPDASAPPQ